MALHIVPCVSWEAIHSFSCLTVGTQPDDFEVGGVLFPCGRSREFCYPAFMLLSSANTLGTPLILFSWPASHLCRVHDLPVLRTLFSRQVICCLLSIFLSDWRPLFVWACGRRVHASLSSAHNCVANSVPWDIYPWCDMQPCIACVRSHSEEKMFWDEHSCISYKLQSSENPGVLISRHCTYRIALFLCKSSIHEHPIFAAHIYGVIRKDIFCLSFQKKIQFTLAGNACTWHLSA